MSANAFCLWEMGGRIKNCLSKKILWLFVILALDKDTLHGDDDDGKYSDYNRAYV